MSQPIVNSPYNPICSFVGQLEFVTTEELQTLDNTAIGSVILKNLLCLVSDDTTLEHAIEQTIYEELTIEKDSKQRGTKDFQNLAAAYRDEFYDKSKITGGRVKPDMINRLDQMFEENNDIRLRMSANGKGSLYLRLMIFMSFFDETSEDYREAKDLITPLE